MVFSTSNPRFIRTLLSISIFLNLIFVAALVYSFGGKINKNENSEMGFTPLLQGLNETISGSKPDIDAQVDQQHPPEIQKYVLQLQQIRQAIAQTISQDPLDTAVLQKQLQAHYQTEFYIKNSMSAQVSQFLGKAPIEQRQKWWASQNQNQRNNKKQALFNHLDNNKDNALDSTEFKQLLNSNVVSGEVKSLLIFEKIDSNNNQLLEIKEWMQFQPRRATDSDN